MPAAMPPSPADGKPPDARDAMLRDPLLKDVPTIAGFKVLEPAVLYAKVGSGGMGAVYRGRHFKLDLDVAIKCLKPSLVAEEGDFVKRFEREARLAASIAHQNVVRVMDVQEKNGLHYLVMEFVRGETAYERVKRKGALAEKEALAILSGTTAGLAAAHARGIVHRDIKPENVMISHDGEVKLADLGLAKSSGGVDGRSVSMPASRIMGTPQYMPPEQWETTDVTTAADVWALGATFYYLVTGRSGISGAGTWQAVMRRITDHEYPTLRTERPDLRPEVHALFERCVQRDPRARFADARAVLKELRKLIGDLDDDFLVDAASGSLRQKDGLVTPPPRETVLRIRAEIETAGAGFASEEAGKPEDLKPTRPSPRAAAAPSTGSTDAAAAQSTLPRPVPGVAARSQVGRRGGVVVWFAAVALVMVVGGGVAARWWSPSHPSAGDDGRPAQAARAEMPPIAAPATSPPVASVEAQAALARGLQLLPQKGQLQAAIAALEEALQRDATLAAAKPPLAAALGRRADQLAESDLDGAFGLCRRALELPPGDAALAAELAQRSEQLRGRLAARLAQGLALREPADGAVVPSRTVVLRGDVDSPNLRRLRVALVAVDAPAAAPTNPVEATIIDGAWSATPPAVADGPHRVLLEGEDGNGVVGALAPPPVVTIDTAAPVLAVGQPPAGAVTAARVRIAGRVQDVSRCVVQVAGVDVEVAPDGSFNRALELAAGAQSIVVAAVDAAGQRTELRHAVTVDATPPRLVVDALPPWTTASAVPIRGVVTGLDGGALQRDGQPVPVDGDGRFAVSAALTADGAAAFVLVAADAVGNEVRQTVQVRRDATPPVLAWTAPDVGKPIAPGALVVEGTVRDAAIATVTVNGTPARVDGERWTAQVAVAPPEPATTSPTVAIDVLATDQAGNAAAPLRQTLRIATGPGPRVATGIGLVLVRIAPATFAMGSPPSETGRSDNETQHRVTIAQPYWIGETEVTQKQWRAVMGAKSWGGDYERRGDAYPATSVSWHDAVAFCAKLTELEQQAGRLPAGMCYTLPTEAEWELACRGSAGNKTAYCYGDDPGRLGTYAVFGKLFEKGNAAEPVRSKQPNAFGLYDMHGNVWEWCADYADFVDGKFVTDTYRDGVTDPLSLGGAQRVNRGGSWVSGPVGCRSAVRGANGPSGANDDLGFRPVLVARPPVK
jgi:serine/threonine protein kinase/formylglycine-generating enzyme required for sulfatase activity